MGEAAVVNGIKPTGLGRELDRMLWTSLAEAICLNHDAPSSATLVDAMAACFEVCSSGSQAISTLSRAMYPILELLRSAGLPAAAKLEETLCKLLEASHQGIDWMHLAKDICRNEDAVVAGSFVKGVISYARHAPRACMDPDLMGSRICPLLSIVAPILEVLRSTSLAAKNDLQVALRAELEALIARPLPSMPDNCMHAEAAKIGNRHPGLRSFLLDPQETEVTFNTTKAGRMEIHRLIDGVIGWGKLSHISQGRGHSRYLIVRKVVNDQKARDLSHMRDLRQKHTELLASL